MNEEIKKEEELLSGQSSKILTPGGESVWNDDGTDVTPINSRNVAIPDGKSIVSLTEKGDLVESENQISNSDFTLWTETPDEWDIDLGRSWVVKTEDADTGDYALQFGEPVDDPIEIKQDITVTPEETYTPSLRVKDGTALYSVFYTVGEDDTRYYYQFSGDNVGTWQRESSDEYLYYVCDGGEGAYATCTPTAFEIPAEVTEITIKIVSADQVKIDNVSLKNEAEEEQMENGGFETWSDISPTGFIGASLGDGGDGYCEKDSIDYQSAPYSAKIVQGTEDQSFIFVGILGGLQTGDSGKITFYAKAGTANDLKVMMWNGFENMDIYAFTGDNAGNWLEFSEDYFSDENFYKSFTLTNEWVKYEIEVPGYGENLIPVIFASATPGGTFNVDDMEGFILSSDPVDYHKIKLTANYSEMTAADNVFNIETADDYSLLKFDKNGVFTSDAFSYFNFSQRQVKVGFSNTAENNTVESALNGHTGIKYFFDTEVDLKQTGATEILIGKDGYKFMPLQVVAETLTADSLSGNGIVELTDGDKVLMNVIYSINPNKCKMSPDGNEFEIGREGNGLSINVSQADAGTSGTIRIYGFGVFIYDTPENN